MWRVIWAQALKKKKIILSVLASEHLPAHSAQLNGSSLLRADIPCGMDLLAEVCGVASRHCGCSSGISRLLAMSQTSAWMSHFSAVVLELFE